MAEVSTAYRYIIFKIRKDNPTKAVERAFLQQRAVKRVGGDPQAERRQPVEPALILPSLSRFRSLPVLPQPPYPIPYFPAFARTATTCTRTPTLTTTKTAATRTATTRTVGTGPPCYYPSYRYATTRTRARAANTCTIEPLLSYYLHYKHVYSSRSSCSPYYLPQLLLASVFNETSRFPTPQGRF